MEQINQNNPYAAPRATLENSTGTGADIVQFPRFSTWWVLLLAIVTLSVYIPYWLHSRSKILNRVMPSNVVAPSLMFTAITLYIVGFMSGIPEAVSSNVATKTISSLLSFASNIAILIWVFSLRNRLNRLLGAAPGDRLWLGGVLTFFFQIFYLQFKINQAIDSGAGEPHSDAPPGAIPG